MVKNVLNTLRKKQKNNKGFSLVELIVVIAIMAVLVGILAPQFMESRLFNVAHKFERANDYYLQLAKI